MFHGTITEELKHHKKWCQYNENVTEERKYFVFAKFSGLQLRSMENMQYFVSIKVCIFSNNFITDIHPLKNCKKLIKLDLHGNQIKSLPEEEFWSGFKDLKLLFLHNNGISKLKKICVLSACPSLVALTLFDCPVSLKKGYRHVIVNSIWSLKALDYYVISDEEIVHNWKLPERFKKFNNRLFFNFCPALKKGSTYEKEIDNISYIISKINRILAHHSPILILQRYVRGYLVRKAICPFLNKRKHKYLTDYKKKWIYIHKRYDNKHFKDLCVQPETNIKGKISRKHIFPSPELWPVMKIKKEDSIEQRTNQEVLPLVTTEDLSESQIRKDQRESQYGTMEEVKHTSFKISVFKVPIHTSDSVKWASVFKTKERDLSPVYRQPSSTSLQRPVNTKNDIMLNKNIKDFFAVHRAGIKLQSLCDVDKYYSGRKMLENHNKKISSVNMAHDSQEKATLKIQETLNEKLRNVNKQILKDEEMIQKKSYQFWKNRKLYLTKVRERRDLFLEEKKQKTEERLLVQKLNNERTRVIKGIINMDRSKKKEDILNEKKMTVKQRQETERYTRGLIKQIQEFRSLEKSRRYNEENIVKNVMAFQKYWERLQDIKTKSAVANANVIFDSSFGMKK